MSFVIDGAEWRFDGANAAEITDALYLLLERMDTARERDEVVWMGDDLFTRPVCAGLDLWSLFGDGSPVSLTGELLQALAASFNGVARYADETEWPPGFGAATPLVIDGATSAPNDDAAWAYYQVCSGHAVACLGLQRTGQHTTRAGQDGEDVALWWVTDEETHRAFFRDAVDVERDTERTLEKLAPHAFPALLFLPGVWRGLGHFEGGYNSVRERLRQHLAVYDSWAKWAFEAAESRAIAARFYEKGADVAPESADVFKDPRCREARERKLQGKKLYCEWHGKLELHQNRVHIHPPVAESGGRVIIAIFHRHLPLPGG